MNVIIVEAVPPRLRGHLRRYLVEVSSGVFVGDLSSRVRDRLWERVLRSSGDGRAILVRSANNEQGYAFDLVGHTKRTVIDLDGFQITKLLHNKKAPSKG